MNWDANSVLVRPWKMVFKFGFAAHTNQNLTHAGEECVQTTAAGSAAAAAAAPAGSAERMAFTGQTDHSPSRGESRNPAPGKAGAPHWRQRNQKRADKRGAAIATSVSEHNTQLAGELDYLKGIDRDNVDAALQVMREKQRAQQEERRLREQAAAAEAAEAAEAERIKKNREVRVMRETVGRYLIGTRVFYPGMSLFQELVVQPTTNKLMSWLGWSPNVLTIAWKEVATLGPDDSTVVENTEPTRENLVYEAEVTPPCWFRPYKVRVSGAELCSLIRADNGRMDPVAYESLVARRSRQLPFSYAHGLDTPELTRHTADMAMLYYHASRGRIDLPPTSFPTAKVITRAIGFTAIATTISISLGISYAILMPLSKFAARAAARKLAPLARRVFHGLSAVLLASSLMMTQGAWRPALSIASAVLRQ